MIGNIIAIIVSSPRARALMPSARVMDINSTIIAITGEVHIRKVTMNSTSTTRKASTVFQPRSWYMVIVSSSVITCRPVMPVPESSLSAGAMAGTE